ncbi:MAG: AAA family ATPase [Provencibacterium sp.]|jgi:AAA15 family ATPase/GTPase|nr:AAA family ATPase [Provencibacterium sp.]
MLIRFAVENFMSFRNLTAFSMAAGKITRHGSHVITERGKRILKGSFLWGANASGKSNLICAVDFAQRIVTEGIKSVNCDKKYFRIEKPYRTKPGVFQFDIACGGHFYSYGFALSYLNAAIEEEWLYQTDENESCIFLRRKTGDGQTIIVDTDRDFSGDRFRVYAQDIGNPKMAQTLFLSDLALRSPEEDAEYQPFRDVADWFRRLVVIFPYSKYARISELVDSDDPRIRLASLLRYFDTGIDDILKKKMDFEKAFSEFPENVVESLKADISRGLQEKGGRALVRNEKSSVEVQNENGELYAFKLTANHGNADDLFDYQDESDGTRRLFDLIPVYQAALDGNVILIDELDRSLHTRLTQEFIRYFYRLTEKNPSQLIATTQDSNLMDLDLLRQDEIWFVERQKDHSSRLYSLNAFKERFDRDVERGYLLGRYGAIPVFRQLLSPEDEDGEEEEADEQDD